ncbi:MAG TPA: DUF4198 domain-containing protein [Candidatus Eisenbacteria bacterium]|nr:DUF4198 domain-containing protein [Candidatus Eisenbacteria bacterium]
MAARKTFHLRLVREVLRVLVFCAGVRSAQAHDFWVSPQPMDPEAGQAVLLRLYAGESFVGDEIPYEAARVALFQHVTVGQTETLAGREGFSPAAFLRGIVPGVHLVGYTSAGTDIQVDAARFNHYLQDEGLSNILAYRRQTGQLGSAAHERYFRYAKALFVTPGARPDPNTSGYVLGQRLEIIPEFDPAQIAQKRGAIRVRVVYEGKPLAGATVFAMPRSNPHDGGITNVTDASGHAAFVLDRPGEWMVKLIWMVPGTQGAEWESSWASLVFRAG